MDNMETTVNTIVGEVLDMLTALRSELEGGPTPGQSEKEHYENYAKMIAEQAEILKTAAYFAQG